MGGESELERKVKEPECDTLRHSSGTIKLARIVWSEASCGDRFSSIGIRASTKATRHEWSNMGSGPVDANLSMSRGAASETDGELLFAAHVWDGGTTWKLESMDSGTSQSSP